jgi:hypothetical protein
MAVFAQSASYRDIKGEVGRISFNLSAATAAAALVAATNVVNLIPPLTNAVFNNAKGAYTSPPAQNAYPGAAAEYESIEDKAVLYFQTATGVIHKYQIPAPKAGIFLADRETVDNANADVAALTAAFVTNQVASRDGALITAFIGGVRVRRRLRRKFNIYTRNPQLTSTGE